MNSQGYEILLVEDDLGDAELTAFSLRKERLASRIVVARDGAEAIDFLFCRGAFASRSFNQPPRLVLLDLKLPRVSGNEVLRAVKADERTRSIPVVVLTSSNQDRDLVECYQLGVNSYIQKPDDFPKFQETVRHFGLFRLVVNHAAPRAAFPVKPPRRYS